MAVLQINFSYSSTPSLISNRKPRSLSLHSPNITNQISHSAISRRLAAIQIAITTDRRDNVIIDRKIAIHQPAGGVKNEEAVERAVRVVKQRAETVAERITERETERLREKSARRGEELSSSERMFLEKMSGEIVRKFMEKPIGYLRNGGGDMEEKLQELNFLLCVLEESFFGKEK